MIFVTVGTDHHPFDRLIREVDLLKKNKRIEDEIFIQTGASLYRPKFCSYSKFIPFNEIVERMKQAKIIITHGGPGTIMLALYYNKVPIAFPRKKKYGEVVDDHQVIFSKKLDKEGQIIAAYDIDEIGHSVENYNKLVDKIKSSKRKRIRPDERISSFVRTLDRICEKLLKKKYTR
jgi:UDP-N-acetylglucosamine transferase subunit ALG13